MNKGFCLRHQMRRSRADLMGDIAHYYFRAPPGHCLDGVLTAGLQGCDGVQNIDADKRGMSQNVPYTARVAAGALGFLTLIQVFDGSSERRIQSI
jgi:hypothetical protein